ncbi:uncharacterized protein [Tenebrio molitor]|uniref:uncharacterized protein isoform X2 n=1 Tax=Tenebrio molitor TaxID=7067 RepID=UPI003624A845
MLFARKFQIIHIYLHFLLHKYVCGDIVTLQKENEICCITETSDYPIFIDPPAETINNEPVNFLMQDNWDNANWLLKDVSNFSNGAVTDKRWEDFEIVKTNYQRFISVTSVSFSIYCPFEMEFITKDDNYLDRFKFYREEQKWYSFTILLQNDTVWYLENDEVIGKRIDFKPSNIFVTTKHETFWKIHKYQFMWSDSAADVKPTTVVIPSTQKSCVMFYVSLCKTCVLYIPKLNLTYMSTDVSEEYVIYSWQSRRLNLEIIERRLTFFKEKTDNHAKGYWGIDIRECPEIVDDNVIYRTQIIDKKETNHTCQIMSLVGKNDKKIASVEERTECEAGKLGQPHCCVSCEAVLGPKYKFCEEHRICENRKCSYAWGYTGRLNTSTVVIGSVVILGLALLSIITVDLIIYQKSQNVEARRRILKFVAYL